jgi:glycosyltransferase involved in cell wall biosynthesis
MNGIVFAEQFYFPEGWGGAQLPRDITTHLAKAGFDVEVVCGSDQYAPESVSGSQDPRSSGVRIRHIPRLLPGNIHRLKLLRQLWFYLGALPLLLFRRRPGLFVTQTNPPLLVPMVALAALLHRCPVVIVAQDLYPEVLFAHGVSSDGHLVGRLLTTLFRWAYRRADRVVSLGPVMTRRLAAKGVPVDRIREISNWATGEESIVRGSDNRLRSAWNLDGKFVVLYSGNIGIAHDVETPIRAVRVALARSPQLRLVFVGTGPRIEEARRLTSELGLEEEVTFHPLVPTDLLPHSLGLADVALVTLRDGFEGLVVPSKLLGCMARAVPALYVGPESDVEQLVRLSGCGLCFRCGAVQELANGITELVMNRGLLNQMGASGSRYYAQHLSRSSSLHAYDQLVHEVLDLR